MIINILLNAFEIFFSKNCLVCKSYSHSLICHRCYLPAVKLIIIEKDNLPEKVTSYHVINKFYSVWSYQNNVRDLFLAIKFNPSLGLIRYVAGLIAEDFRYFYKQNKWDMIVPVPSSKEGYNARGFNHVYELFAYIQRYTDKIADYSDILVRADNRLAQSKVSGVKRQAGLNRRYRLKGRVNLEGKKILLVDDILTTGSTVTAAALTLRKAGASQVDVFTICYNYRN